jgi:hypothetical protein
MPTDRHLRWIHENRQHRSREVTLGKLAKQYLGGTHFRWPADRDKIAQTVQITLGDSLAGHCTIGEFVGGVQVIYVDDSAVLYHLRLDARKVVLQALAARKSRQKVREVRFLLLPGGG